MSVRRGYVDTGVGQAHYRSTSRSASVPALVLLHQTPLSSATFEPLLEVLEGRVYAIALDTPGFGLSDPAPAGWTIADYSRNVWQAVEDLGVERPYLLGQRTGATIALECGLQDPGRARGHILMALPWADAEEGRRRIAVKVAYTVAADGSHLASIWSQFRAQSPKATPAINTDCVRETLQAGPESYLQLYSAVYAYPIAERLPLLHGEILFICPTEDRLLGDHRLAAATRPDARAIELPGLSDFAAAEDPLGLAAPVLEFMGTREEP